MNAPCISDHFNGNGSFLFTLFRPSQFFAPLLILSSAFTVPKKTTPTYQGLSNISLSYNFPILATVHKSHFSLCDHIFPVMWRSELYELVQFSITHVTNATLLPSSSFYTPFQPPLSSFPQFLPFIWNSRWGIFLESFIRQQRFYINEDLCCQIRRTLC